jgi:FkbM family methyltransferase
MFEIFVGDCYRAAHIRPGAIVIDIGANIGCYSLLAARHAARVLACEPYPENLSLLRENVALNNANNVEIIPYAIASRAGTNMLFIPVDDSFVGRISLHPGRGSRTVETTCVTLEQIIREAGLDKVDVLKIDCQGAEYEILYGASPETLSRVQQIITECEVFDDEHPDWSAAALKSYLQTCDFNVQMNGDLLYAYR